jgi:cell filamentation protein
LRSCKVSLFTGISDSLILRLFTALHPFREGNGRAAREFFRTLSLAAGYYLDWGAADAEMLLEADINAFDRDYKPLKEILFDITSEK